MTSGINLIEKAVEKVENQVRLKEIKRALEALLFASSEPLSLEKLKDVIGSFYPLRISELELLIQQLGAEYQQEGRAFQIDQIAGGYQLRTSAQMRPYIERLHQDKRGEKLSNASTEVLAIIAFRSPITRREIENLRGVDCSATVAALLERGLIEAVGRKESPGRPLQYGVTKQFLAHFGLKSLSDLQNL